MVYCPTHLHLATRPIPLAPLPRAQLSPSSGSAADVPPPPIADPPTASDPPAPSRPIDTCHHALIDCPHADLVSIRHIIFRSWADLILSFLPSSFVPAHDLDLDPDALASSLYALHAPDPSCILLPRPVSCYNLSGEVGGGTPPPQWSPPPHRESHYRRAPASSPAAALLGGRLTLSSTLIWRQKSAAEPGCGPGGLERGGGEGL